MGLSVCAQLFIACYSQALSLHRDKAAMDMWSALKQPHNSDL